MYIVKSGMSYVLNAKTGEMIGINSDNESQRLGCAMQAERYSFEEAKAVVASMESRGLAAEILQLKVGSAPLVNVSIPVSKVKKLQQLLTIEHEHHDGMNECAICDQPLIDAAIEEIERLQKLLVGNPAKGDRTGIELIADERRQQIEVHGFDADNDDAQSPWTLRSAAIYVLTLDDNYYPRTWDIKWKSKFMKKSRIQRAIVAAALLAALLDMFSRGTYQEAANG